MNMAPLSKKTVERAVCSVQKPGRYIGGELNSVVRADATVRMGISYPDLYEIGMSNNGIKILYARANDVPGAACERFFPVDLDFEKKLRAEDIPLYTLETYTPIHELDIVGFNISHELLYTNVLQCLDLGRIPLTRFERGESHPIVIAGGGGLSNPLPAFDFFDLIFIGDGEEAITEILTAMIGCKGKGLGRSEKISALSEIPGVLNPALYRIDYQGPAMKSVHGPAVRKRSYRLDGPSDPVRPLVPNIRIAQERVVVEVARGCKNFCKFCHAGYYDLPYRSCKPGDIGERLDMILDNTGYNEVTLSSLSISDYSGLVELLNRILPDLTRRGISISLPSLRVDMSTIPVAQEISDVRKTSLTFAVESASKVLRERAGKNIVDEEILELSRFFLNRGWRVIKLYFMIGMPGCTEEDEAESIISLLKRIIGVTGKKCELNVTLSPFVPKPHTPFQRESQMDAAYLADTVMKVKRGLPRNIKIKNHEINSSILEGVIARGDTRLGGVILNSYRAGCRFDSWSEHFHAEKWESTLNELLPCWRDSLRARDGDEVLPWSIINTGFEAITAKKEAGNSLPARSGKSAATKALDVEAFAEAKKDFSLRYGMKETVRIRFSKTGPARFVSHIDYMEILKRGMRMAGFPLTFSQGFNKREKISAGYPVPLGIESESELCDVELYDSVDDGILERLAPRLPEGIRPVSMRKIAVGRALMALISVIEYQVKGPSRYMDHVFGNFRACNSLIREKNHEKKEIRFEDAVHSWESLSSDELIVRLFVGRDSSVRIDECIMNISGITGEDFYLFRVIKKCQYALEDGVLAMVE